MAFAVGSRAILTGSPIRRMNALVLQCGGPTAVVNTSLAALVRRWRIVARGGTLYGGRYGLAALMNAEWMSLSDVSEGWLAAIEASPGMALGGGRDRLREWDLDAAVARMRSSAVDTMFLLGGNGTMAAARALWARAANAGVPLRVVGVPKTIDNDIPGTDVCPGFPSAARFLVEAVRDVAADVSSMRGYEDVVLLEAMGRHSGWLAASTLLARSQPHDAPHIVLLPERTFTEVTFLDAVREQHARAGICIVTVAEGVRDSSGVFLAEQHSHAEIERDASGQVILGRSGGPLPYLAALVRRSLGLRCRLVRPDVLQRCSRAHVSTLDRRLASMVGTAAADFGVSDGGTPIAIMVALRLDDGSWRTEGVPLERIRGERPVPPAMQSDATPLRSLLE